MAPWLSAQLAAERVTPRRERVTVSPRQPLSWTLNEPVSATAVKGATVKVWGRWGGAVPGAVSLRDDGYTVRSSPVPALLPQGMSATFQALVYNPADRAVGFTLCNPIAVFAK